MSFSDWYGASALITLAAQGESGTSVSVANSITVTTPTFAVGDIAIVFVKCYDHGNANSLNLTGPSGFTALSSTQKLTNFYSNKGGSGYNGVIFNGYYKVLAAGDTSISASFGIYGNNAQMTCQVYRPSDTISTISNNDVATTSSNTINCAASSLSVIAYGGSANYSTGDGYPPQPNHTWGLGPTYNQLFNYSTRGSMRAGSYMQDGSSPSDVTWSVSNVQAPVYLSGYLEIS